MRIEKKYKLQKCLGSAKDRSPENLQGIIVGKGAAYASDGTTLARVPVQVSEGEALPDAFGLSPVTLKEAHGKPSSYAHDSNEIAVQVDASGKGTVTVATVAGTVQHRLSDEILPVELLESLLAKRPSEGFRRCLNIAKLANLAQALGCDELHLEFPRDPEGTIRALPVDRNGAVGLIAHRGKWEAEELARVFGYELPEDLAPRAPIVEPWPNGKGFDVLDTFEGERFKSTCGNTLQEVDGGDSVEYFVQAGGTKAGKAGTFTLRCIVPRGDVDALALVQTARALGVFAKEGDEAENVPTMRLRVPAPAQV